MTPGEIGTLAGRIFNYHLPSNWILRDQEDQNDHGIDAEIEVKDSKGLAQGKDYVFKVQIKGEEHSRFVLDNQFLSFTLRTSKLQYYLSFNIPVILIVVEVDSERVFWLSITDNEDLIDKARHATTDSVQIHLPVQNLIKRRDEPSTQAVLEAVFRSWDYLAVKGVTNSVKRFGDLSPASLESRIATMGDALYKAHHQQLENLLGKRDFVRFYDVASRLIESSIVPGADRFVAGLFYRRALRIAPTSQTLVDQMVDLARISGFLIRLARQERTTNLRHYAIGLARCVDFRYSIDSLMANHNAEKALGDSPEGFLFRIQMHAPYLRVCTSLKKIIDLLGVIAAKGQYNIFYDVYTECAPSLLYYKAVQQERGSKGAINYFSEWLNATFKFCLTYAVLVGNIHRVAKLYSLALHAQLFDADETRELKLQLSSIDASAFTALDEEEKNYNTQEKVSFLDLSNDQQKNYFRDTARNMGMDPDDSDNELGRIVARGLQNYDPTDILTDCEHLFVEYRPGGIVASALRMHSAGGMHMLLCLKHKHVHGTGNLLSELYDSSSQGPFRGFKQQHCGNCSDCVPRAPEWKWSLAWQWEERPKHEGFLNELHNW